MDETERQEQQAKMERIADGVGEAGVVCEGAKNLGQKSDIRIIRISKRAYDNGGEEP